jgi:hypothetical protein
MESNCSVAMMTKTASASAFTAQSAATTRRRFHLEDIVIGRV